MYSVLLLSSKSVSEDSEESIEIDGLTEDVTEWGTNKVTNEEDVCFRLITVEVVPLNSVVKYV